MANETLPLLTSGSRLTRLPRCDVALYAFLLILHLVPIWAFPYVPTQDGPWHLANAIILKDYGASHTRYHEFFELGWPLFPHWSSHLMIAGLLSVFSPLVAHKILASLYVIGFAVSFRYFLASFDNQKP